MPSDVTLELEIDALIEEGWRKANARDSGRQKGFHVSGLSYDCLRNIQYGVSNELAPPEQQAEMEPEELEGIIRMMVGTKLHEIPLTRKHEWGVYWTFVLNGQKVQIHGHIDEVHEREDGTEVIIDKKFVGSVPRSPNQHHMRQVSYYAALYAASTGATVKEGALAYFCPAIKQKNWEGKWERKRTFSFPIDVEAARKELLDKVTQVVLAMQAKTLIERKPGWLCDYCHFKPRCIADSGPLPGQQSFGK